METIDYTTRTEMVAALMDARQRGVEVEVVGNGRTLKFPNGIGATAEDEQPEVEPEKEAPADGVEKTPVEGDTLLGVVPPEEEPGLDRSTFTVEGICSTCQQPALAEPDGTWVHAEAATHGDTEGEFIPTKTEDEEEKPAVEDEDEDLIGTPAPVKAQPSKKSSKRSRS